MNGYERGHGGSQPIISDNDGHDDTDITMSIGCLKPPKFSLINHSAIEHGSFPTQVLWMRTWDPWSVSECLDVLGHSYPVTWNSNGLIDGPAHSNLRGEFMASNLQIWAGLNSISVFIPNQEGSVQKLTKTLDFGTTMASNSRAMGSATVLSDMIWLPAPSDHLSTAQRPDSELANQCMKLPVSCARSSPSLSKFPLIHTYSSYSEIDFKPAWFDGKSPATKK